ncbi:MAG: SPOR domain-containing protein [Deltaproteobacteria bacterium]|nr:SPOR domain-containing protein [Deltaproteobacteria bacterium]
MAQYDLNLRDYWRVIKKRKFIIIFTVLSMGLFSLLFSILWRPIPLFNATASIKVDRSGSITGLYLEAVSWSQADYMQTQASVIKSYYIIEIAAKRLGLIPPEMATEEIHANQGYQNIILGIRDSITTEQEGYSTILNITVTSRQPKTARQLANTLAYVYKEQHLLELNRRTIEAKKFIENQLEVVQRRLNESEEAVRRFREANDLISLDSQTSALLNQKAVLLVAYDKALTSRDKIEEVSKRLKGAGKDIVTAKDSYYIDEASSLYKSLNDQLVRFMLERDTLLLTYTEHYPHVVELNKKIRETLGNMTAQLSSQYTNVQESIRDFKSRIDSIEKRIQQLPELGLELARLEEKVQVSREVYLLLEKKYQETLIKEAEKIEEVQIVKPAMEPTQPINPPKTNETAAVGILLGLILGVVFAFVVETFDLSIGAIEEVEEMTGVKALGIIPHVSLAEVKETIAADRPGRDIDDKTAERYARILSHFAPKSTLAESYRALRTNLKFTGLKENMKNIMFTSSSPQEGKSTVVANLAITMAQDGKKVLIIDGDMRKPMVAHIFGIEQAPGLADVILGNYSWREVVRTVSDVMMGKMSVDDVMITPGMDNLSILTSGTLPPNPSELVSVDAINQILTEAASEYDLVLWDSPPILSATDATILSSKMDGVVMVYRVGKIPRNTLKRAKAQLDNVNAHVIGVVLNGLKAEISPDFTKHDYYRYYDYYSDREHKKKGLMNEIRELPSMISAFIKKKEKKEKKELASRGSPLNIIILLLILLLLCLSILYQLGVIKIPRLNAVAQGSQGDQRVERPTAPRDFSKDSMREDEQSGKSRTVNTAKRENESDGTKWLTGYSPAMEQTPVAATRTALYQKNETAGSAGKERITYALRIGSYQSQAYAQQVADDLTADGFSARWLPYTIPDEGVWYRVFVGHFATESEAFVYMRNHGLDRRYPGVRVLEPRTAPVLSYSRTPVPDMRNKLHGAPTSWNSGNQGVLEEETSPVMKYAIHIGSFSIMNNAKKLTMNLNAQGFDAQWKEFVDPRGTWHRVIVGRFDEKGDATAFMEKNGFDTAYPGSRILYVAFPNTD